MKKYNSKAKHNMSAAENNWNSLLLLILGIHNVL